MCPVRITETTMADCSQCFSLLRFNIFLLYLFCICFFVAPVSEVERLVRLGSSSSPQRSRREEKKTNGGVKKLCTRSRKGIAPRADKKRRKVRRTELRKERVNDLVVRRANADILVSHRIHRSAMPFLSSRWHHYYLRRNKGLVYSTFGTDWNGIFDPRGSHVQLLDWITTCFFPPPPLFFTFFFLYFFFLLIVFPFDESAAFVYVYMNTRV